MSENNKLNSKKILVVDDEEIIRKSCDLALKKAGHKIVTVENGIKALKLLAKNDFDIVLLDLKMPLMDGFELLTTIRRDYTYIQVIIITGNATVENAINAMKQGAYDFIIKPFKADQLRRIIDRCSTNIDLNSEIQRLKIANKKLKEVQDMKDKFIAITSHELRTPVSHLKGYFSILKYETEHKITGVEKEGFLKIINAAIIDLENIVHNMFDIIKFEKDRFNLNIENIELHELIKNVVNEFQLIIKQRNMILKLPDLNDTISIAADRSKLKQVISELLQNAIKFTPDRGLIEINTAIKSDFCVLEIIDNGVGIKESEKGKIFEKFYEIQNTDYHSSSKTNFMGGGIGLGLSIIKAIVEAHNGRVTVESEYGNGAKFTVILPLN